MKMVQKKQLKKRMLWSTITEEVKKGRRLKVSKSFANARCCYKQTDFRYQMYIKEKRRALAWLQYFRLQQNNSPIPKNVVTVDTSKAKSNSDVLKMCIKGFGWKEFPFGRKDKACDIYWNAANFNDNYEAFSGKVNKFPGSREVFSKINLFHVLDLCQKLYPRDYDFYPKTWCLPQQLPQFITEGSQLITSDKNVVFIIKPDEGAQGEGIYMIRKPYHYNFIEGKNHIAQIYVWKPLLMDKYKFDLRIYVVLMSVEPLEFYICYNGLVRFCTIPYHSPTVKNLHKSYMHLTNYSLNKYSNSYNSSDKENYGSKRTLTSLFEQLQKMGHNTDTLWTDIEKLVCKSMLAVAGEIKVHIHTASLLKSKLPKSFQILGFDILITDQLKPLLLEINASPSLSVQKELEISRGVTEFLRSPKDIAVKWPLVRDTLLLVVPRSKIGNIEKLQEQRLNKRLQLFRTLKHFSTVRKDLSEEGDADDECDSEDEETRLMDLTPKAFIKPGSSLKLIYPTTAYVEEFQHLHLLTTLADIFSATNGHYGTGRMGPSAFRTFTRKCRLKKYGMSNALLDILFLDVQRKQQLLNYSDVGPGLSFKGFVDICFELAKRIMHNESEHLMVKDFVHHCESNLKADYELKIQMKKQLLPKRLIFARKLEEVNNSVVKKEIIKLDKSLKPLFTRKLKSLNKPSQYYYESLASLSNFD